MDAIDRREMLRHLPWPFPGKRFPDHLGAVVQRTVLSGESPARLVIHTAENDWAVGDVPGSELPASGRTDTLWRPSA